MPIDLPDSKRVFQLVGGDRAGLFQQGEMPAEKDGHHRECQNEPHRQPNQCPAEGFFGTASVPQGTQNQGEEQTHETVTKVECDALERKYCRAPARFDQGVEIIGEDETDGDYGGAQWERKYYAPPSPAERQSDQTYQDDDRQPGKISQWRDPLHHTSGDWRDHETERSEPRPDQTITRCRQIDEPEIGAREGQEQPGYGVEQQARKNHEERERRANDPPTGGENRLDRGFLARRRRVTCGRSDALGFPVWLPHAEGEKERERGRDKVEINWKAERYALGESARATESDSDFIHEPGIVDRAANEHGDDQTDRLPAGNLVEDLRPFCGSSALGEGVKYERLVSAARQALGDPAEQSIHQANKKEQHASADGSHAKDRHLYDHDEGGPDHERPPADPIRQSAGWEIRKDNGESPGKIQQCVLSSTEAQVQEEHRQYRVIKSRVEEHAKKDKAPPITVGSIADIRSAHENPPKLAAFSWVANAYRNGPIKIIVALALLLPFAGLAVGQEPTPVPTPARTHLVVGLTESPPFCIRNKDGTWSGISVELWQWIAADLQIDTEFREATVTGLLDDLAPGRPLDVSIGGLTITADREDHLDFTQPFYLSGLGVAVKAAPGAGGLWPWIGRVLAWSFWRIVAALVVSLALVALLIWALEHKGNPKEFGGDGKVHRGIGSALWWSAVTMTTVGYGDLAPRSPAGRVVAIAWMFISLFLVSWFTASMASILTAERLDTGSGSLVVRGPDDLRRLRVAAIGGTSSEDYLRRRQIDFIRVPPKELLAALLSGRVQAVLGDAPFLRYGARSDAYVGKITVLPQTLQVEPYGIALRENSPWRRAIDRAMLHRIADPAWRDLVYRYLGTAE
jgi:polar amino acid transport system substrate-binding protein